jgi:hypothetical protein
MRGTGVGDFGKNRPFRRLSTMYMMQDFLSVPGRRLAAAYDVYLAAILALPFKSF